MSGDVNLYTPGARPGVMVVADATGTVAQRGQLVEIVGENRDGVEVALCTTAGNGIGHLLRTPEEYDETETYADGDAVGDVPVGLRAYVDWFEADVSALSPGDLVVSAADGGVRAYDAAGGDTVDMILGRVWRTGSHGAGTATKAAVIHR